MKITVQRMTPEDYWKELCAETMGGKVLTKTTWKDILEAEHSPIRGALFAIRMEEIPTFVSVHIVRHKQGVEHFVKSMRDDRGGGSAEEVNRLTPVNHTMLLNAQAILTMSRRRLCRKAHRTTRDVFQEIRRQMLQIDPELASCMVPMCNYRGGICYELRSCGFRPHWKTIVRASLEEIPE